MNIAIITGATSGMGKEFVNKIVKEAGPLDEIWILGRRKERLEAWGRLYPKVQFRLFPIDVNKEADREFFHHFLEEKKPKVSIFVHAAGFGIIGNIDEIPLCEQEEMADTNMRSCISFTGYVLPYMKKGGRMIYFASAAAFLPQPGFAVYAASKAFVLSYVRSLRAENRHCNLKITAVCPGSVRTEFFNRAAASKPIAPYKKLVMATAGKVVDQAWKDNSKNKEISVYGLPMKGFFLATKLIPHGVFLHFMGRSGKK